MANATIAIKLVAELLRDLDLRVFWYKYRIDSHTSLVGIQELAAMGNQCLRDTDFDALISDLSSEQANAPKLFAFTAQSNSTADVSSCAGVSRSGSTVQTGPTGQHNQPPCVDDRTKLTTQLRI